MKKIIEYLKIRVDAIKSGNGHMDRFDYENGTVISGNEAQKIIDFYESTIKESGLSEAQFLHERVRWTKR